MTENQEKLRLPPSSSISSIGRVWDTLSNSLAWNALSTSVASSEQTLRHPEGRTAATDRSGNDEWSDENIQRWLERDRLDPELDEWVRLTLGE